MPADDIDDLRRRSDGFGVDPSDEALAVNRAILELAPADPVASNRLGIALMNLGDLDASEAVLKATVEEHPENQIAARRLVEIQQARDRPVVAPKPRAAPRRARGGGPGYWIKGLHHDADGWTIAPGAESWISDPGRRTRDGKRVLRADGVAWGEPSWIAGDEIGLYLGGTYKVPVLVAVIAPPAFDPAFVQENSDTDDPEEGERYPWVTRVRGVGALPVETAPTLDDLGIERGLVQRRPRFTITPDQHKRLAEALRGPDAAEASDATGVPDGADAPDASDAPGA